LRKSVEQLTKDVSSLGKTMTEQLKADAESRILSAREAVTEVAGEIGAKGKESVETVEQAVKDNPFQGLLVAFGAGLLLAQFLGRR
jgi:ElaB/YqjD/DUF883 family membrane-anchored ribosome-binding protein